MTASAERQEILVVEDETALREIIVEELIDEGFDVREAGHGKDAVQAIHEKVPDLVLCDITMPVMDGYQFVTHIRETLEHLDDMPILFLSALAERADMLKGLEIGADDYITKPIDFDLLIFRIRSRLREVARMLEKRDKQMVKLYHAINDHDPQIENGEQPQAPGVAHGAPHGEAPSSTVVGGRVFMVNVDTIREKLGTRWGRYKDHVCGQTEHIIRQAICERDVVRHNGDGEFVIQFADSDERIAAGKAQVISDKVIAHFHTDDSEQTKPDFRADTERMDIPAHACSNSETTLAAITETFKRLSIQAIENLDQTFQSICDGCRIEWQDLQTPSKKPTALKVPTFDWETLKVVNRLRTALDDDSALCAELDALMLRQIEAGFLKGIWQDRRLVISTISFSTIINASKFSHFRDTHRSLDKTFAKKLMFLIMDVPSTVALSDHMLEPLTGLSKLRGFHLKEPRITAAELERLNPVLVAYSYPAFANRVATGPGEAIVLVGLAKAVGAKTLVFDLPAEAQEMAANMEVDLITAASR